MAVFLPPRPPIQQLLQQYGPCHNQMVRAAGEHEGCPFLNHFSKYHSTASLRAFEQLKNTNAQDRYARQTKSLLVIGLSFHTAPMELREKLAVADKDWPRVVQELRSLTHIEEAAVLSTCNRTEFYVLALSWYMGVLEITQWMSKVSGVPVEELRPHLFVFREDDVVRHLFRVSSGLDSLVLGEAQIQSQVKQVLRLGQGEFGLGHVITRLFKFAREAGALARATTDISTGAMSVSAAAVELAALKLGSAHELRWRKVVIVGAGTMSRLLVKHLISKGCPSIVIVNRTEQSVEDMRKQFIGRAVLEYRALEQMHASAGEADVIFTCTASGQLFFVKDNVSQLPPAPGGSIRFFIDISVPRNVGSCVEDVPDVRAYNVDHLKEVVAANQEKRRQEAAKAEIIIDEEVHKFMAWRDSMEAVPTIKKLRAYAEKIRQHETGKLYRKMGKNIPDYTKELIDSMSKSLMNKFLDGPQRRLKCNNNDPEIVRQTVENRHALERMFGLQDQRLYEEEEEEEKHVTEANGWHNKFTALLVSLKSLLQP